ncbi:MAG: hypothetical protein SGILL_003856 [Bacillariaceae sp.]
MAEPASNVQVEDIFRSEYREWGLRYGKKIDFGNEERFKNFQLNFMLQMQHNKKTGIFYLLNEYGDLTSEEYHQLMRSTVKKKKKTRKGTPANVRSPQVSRDRPHSSKLSGVDVVEALAKTAQEYQNFLTRKSASQHRRNSSSRARDPSHDQPKPKSPPGGQSSSAQPKVHEENQEFLDGYRTQPQVSSPDEPSATNKDMIEDPSKGYSVIAELVLDPPPQQEKHDSVPFYESTEPRVNPPPKVQAMGADPNGQIGGQRSQPGTLEPKFFNAVKGKPSNKSFFTGIGTQVVGVSSNKRLVQWEPGMDQWS